MIRRLVVATVLSICPVLAGPPLTTIQDVLYKADGTRFSGLLTISWTSFQAVDNSSVVTQSTNVRVVNGNLRVQLVPNTTSTPPTMYTVTYNSDGAAQFQEFWSVPSSLTPLHVRDVRTAPASQGGADVMDAVTAIPESGVTGLVSDLAVRPLMGPGYAAGYAAMVDSNGQLESVVGNPADCVHVDGSSGPCGGGSGAVYNFVDGDSPVGTIDGSNTVFTLNGVPNPTSSLTLYRNGVLQAVGLDYTASSSGMIEFAPASTPQPTDVLVASYRTASSSSGTTWPAPQVLCSGTGTATSLPTPTVLGACNIPGGLLTPGDRIEIHVDYVHTGSAGTVAISVQWGGTTTLNAVAPATETMLTGRVDAAVLTTGAQVSSQSWGAVTALAAGLVGAPDSYSGGLSLAFRGSAAAGADTITLVHYSVVRVP